MSLFGNLLKEARTGVKTTSKARPFISSADKAAMALTRPKGTGKEFMTELKKTKGVKPAEIEHRKLDQIEALPKMTKDQFLAELESRPPVDVSESMLKTISPSQAAKDEASYDRYNTAYRYLTAWQRQGVDESLASAGPKFSEYQLPGGQNYREILLHLPSFGEDDRLMYLDAKKRHGGLTPELETELEQLKAEKASFGQEYLSSHWGADNPNILAHMRVQDRLVEQPPEMRYVAINKNSGFPSQDFATPEELDAYIKTLPENIQNSLVIKQAQIAKPPKKVLHVEEVQSDWHQEGRKKGYIDPSKKPYTIEQDQNGVYRVRDQSGQRFDPYVDGQQMSGFMTAEAAENAMKGNMGRMPKPTGVPDAPFKKNWHELAMKRLINYAAENGYDSIAITPGVEQAKRYDLSKHIESVNYIPSEERLIAKDHQGKVVLDKTYTKPEDLPEHIGKDLAQKLLATEPTTVMSKSADLNAFAEPKQMHALTGQDIRVGGEGMSGFYDKMLPDYLNQFGKPYGAQVELGGHKLPGDPSLRGEASERLGLAGQSFADMTPEEIAAFNATLDESNATSLHHFPITPEMRESINKERLPLYQQVGIPLGAGSAGSQVEMPFAQQPQQPEQPEEPAYATGGAVYDTAPDMSDGGQMIQGGAFKRGGKVHFTDNLDTMFMELHDKMFKRK